MRDLPDSTGRPVLALADLTDAAGTWARLCRWLHAGATTPTHTFRWPVVSTTSADGTPEVRVVVLRRFDEPTRTLVFHTDVRSAKVAELKRHPHCGFLFHDPDDRIQLRLRTSATLHHADDFARREYATLPPFNRATYSAVTPPGVPLAPDAPFDYPPKPPADDEVAFRHFLAVACVVQTADALELHPSGHRRAKFEWTAGGVRMTRVGA